MVDHFHDGNLSLDLIFLFQQAEQTTTHLKLVAATDKRNHAKKNMTE
jgi:hypothetical protein